MRLCHRQLCALTALALTLSPVAGFVSSSTAAFLQPEGKGSPAYVARHQQHPHADYSSLTYRKRSPEGPAPRQHYNRRRRPSTHLYFNPANMMANLSSNIVSSIETALESPDVKSLFLAMDDKTWLSILVYSLVFWVGMFVAISSDDMKTVVPAEKKRKLIQAPSAPTGPPVSYAKYTRVTTNTQSEWNMENDRRRRQQQQQQQQVNSVNNKKQKDDAVAAMWERREKVRTVITYERVAPAPFMSPPPTPPAETITIDRASNQFSAPAPAVPAMMEPPPAPAVWSIPPAPAPALYSPRPAVAVVAPPAMTSAQYMAGLGSSSAGKRSYAISGPNYSNVASTTSRRRSYDMVKWTPDTPVAITSLYLAKMSGPDRPALGSYYQVPVYFSPGVIPVPKHDVGEETYLYQEQQPEQPYQPQTQEEYYGYEEYEEDDYLDDIPLGKGSGYHHHYQPQTYAPTRWKPDMRVNESGPGASQAYLSNMRQPAVIGGYTSSSSSSSYRFSTVTTATTTINNNELDVYPNGRMNGFSGDSASVSSVASASSSTTPYGTVNNRNANGATANAENFVFANGELHGSFASAHGGANNAADTADPYSSMSTWQPSSYASDDGRASTSATSHSTPPALPEPPALYQPSLATTAATQESSKKQSYSMTSWKPGSVTPVQGLAFAGNSYLAAINAATIAAKTPPPSLSNLEIPSASDIDVPVEFHEPPAPVPYRPSFASISETSASGNGGTTSKKSYSMTKWQPGSAASTSASFGNSYLSAMSSTRIEDLSRDQAPAIANRPPAPSPYLAVENRNPAIASTSGSAFGVSDLSGMSSSDLESPATQGPMYSQPPSPTPYMSSRANEVMASKKSYSVTKWKPDANASADSPAAINMLGASPPSLSPPAVAGRPAPSSYQPAFSSIPASFSNYPTIGQSSNFFTGKQTRPSDSIIRNAYFNGMGSMYGNTEAPRSLPPPRLHQNPPPFGNEGLQNFDGSSRSRDDEDSWRSPVGPPVLDVAESEAHKRVQQIQMQT